MQQAGLVSVIGSCVRTTGTGISDLYRYVAVLIDRITGLVCTPACSFVSSYVSNWKTKKKYTETKKIAARVLQNRENPVWQFSA